jgi:hypothetical protein
MVGTKSKKKSSTQPSSPTPTKAQAMGEPMAELRVRMTTVFRCVAINIIPARPSHFATHN